MNVRSIGCAALLMAIAALPARASTLPRADTSARGVIGLGLGDGVSVSVDTPVSSMWTLGGSLGATLGGGTRFDLRTVYAFVHGGRHGLSVSGILGLWGGTGFSGPLGLAPGLEIGFGLAYPLTAQWTGRLNLVVPYYGLLTGPYYYVFGGPSGGLEIGYLFRPHLEGTIGSNGYGNLLGLKLEF